MEGGFIKINEWLLPLSWLYGLGVRFRNFLFDVGVLKSRAYRMPIISVGNITVGGTGKTPHVEYLARLLKDKLGVAILSRGYKRKGKGYVLAGADTTMEQIGDEPFQMKQKFPDVTVAVDKNRRRAIEHLSANDSVDVILLDDAFQHRYVKPGLNILLVDYHRLIIYDQLLPAGRLREPLDGKNRADIVIITKCPKDLKPVEYRVITRAMNLYPFQYLYFSTLEYEPLQPVFGTATSRSLSMEQLKEQNVLLLTGIASPRQLTEELTPQVKSLTSLVFADHHNFSRKDIRQLNDVFDYMPMPRMVITTEKDAARLTNCSGLSDEVRQALYKLPVRISFMLDQEDSFDQNILEYVQKNARRRIHIKKKETIKTDSAPLTDGKPRTISFR